MSTKIVFILDHNRWSSEYCGEEIDIDALYKGVRGVNYKQLPTARTTLWSATLLASIEYSRLVWDLFPYTHLIRFMVTDAVQKSVGSWKLSDQNNDVLLEGVAHACSSLPDRSNGSRSSLKPALKLAVDWLREKSEKQEANDSNDMDNDGRIMLISHFASDREVNEIETYVSELVDEGNSKILARSLQISSLRLTTLNVRKSSEKSAPFVDVPKTMLDSKIVTSEIYSTKSGTFLSGKMLQLIQTHYSLSSTTITSIPMKEEQNATQSANYDVEVLHHEDLHAALWSHGDVDSRIVNASLDAPYMTVMLKWASPRLTYTDVSHCSSSYRITPVDVCSRQSICLVTFLRSGKLVALEHGGRKAPSGSGAGSTVMPGNTNKTMSHVMAWHGADIFMHSLAPTRSNITDIPSISEGLGGKVGDYRIQDVCDLLKKHTLIPHHVEMKYEEKPSHKAIRMLERATSYCPLVLSETILYNMKDILAPFIECVQKECLSDEDLLQCQNIMQELKGKESRGESLPITANANLGNKRTKRDDQYKQLWFEVDSLCKSYRTDSVSHQKLYEIVCNGKTLDLLTGSNITLPGLDDAAIRSPSPPSSLLQSTTTSTLLPSAEESPASPTTDITSSAHDNNSKGSQNSQSLLDWYREMLEDKYSKRRKVSTMTLADLGEKVELYSHLNNSHASQQQT